MDKIFIVVLNMSFTGAFVIAAICAARLLLKKAPKIISYSLWAVAGFRLVFPFSFESVISLIPFNTQPIPTDIAMQAVPRIESGVPFVNSAVSSILPPATSAASVNPLQIWTTVGAYVWLIGVIAMVVYGIISYTLLKRKMRFAVHAEANIYEAANIKSPFLLGIFVPRIYLPVSLSALERDYVILHEQTHINRRDYLVKFFAYFVLCLHWFNPLAWAAFLLMGADMEMSCDERVLKDMGADTKKDYSLSLLSLAAERRVIAGSPLAFGEGGIKERIKNVLKFRKPSRLIVVVSVALVAMLSVGFAANRQTSGNEPLAAAMPQETPSAVRASDFEPRKWLDYYLEEQMPWGGNEETVLPEFPGTTFKWTPYAVTAMVNGTEKVLIEGMPVWSVYFADISGDGLPEICATVSIGSGIVDTRIIVYDFSGDATYELADRFYYDYNLAIENGRLMVTQTKSNMDANSGEVTGKGAPAIIDGELTAGGIDRTTPAAEFADFLKSEDGIAFQSTAYQAAKALLSADAEELSAYMAEPSDAVRATRGLTDILGSIDDLILVTGIDSIKSENEISVSYRYSVTGEDSLSYVTMALRKIDGVWKVQWLGIEK